MRIPSQFNEDSLYRRGGRSAQSAQSYRRLLRLVIGLALVLVLMRQASKPEMYRVFFGQPPAPGRVQGADVGSSVLSMDKSNGPARVEIMVDAVDRKIANLLATAISASDQRRWIVALTRWQRGVEVPEFPSTAESLREELSQIDSIEESRRVAWDSMLQSLADRVANQTQAGQTESLSEPNEKEMTLVTAMLAALDEAADARVVDGSVWRSGDFDAFYRYLDQSSEFSPAGLAATGVLPLLQQPDVFRGQMVRVHGTVARAEQLDATENVYGIDSYWQLWLRPADGVERPMVVVVPEVSDEVAGVGSGEGLDDGPPVIVAGRFLKRLAYTSSMGADLAPVVVGRIAVADVAPQAVVAEIPADSSSRRLRITILLACACGFGLAVIAMRRTAVAAREARRLRTAHRQSPSFDSLHSQSERPDDESFPPSITDRS